MSPRWLRCAVVLAIAGCGGAAKGKRVPNSMPTGGGQDAGSDAGSDAGRDGSTNSLDGRVPDGVVVVGDVGGDLGNGGATVDVMVDTQPPSKPAYIIDDMERADMAASFRSPAGFMGKWSAVANFVLGQQPLPSASEIIRRLEPARGASERAAMLSAPRVEDGADLFIDLRPLTGAAQHVDLSRYTGIAFWSRIVGGTAETKLFFVAIKDDTYPISDEEFWVGQTMTTPWFSAPATGGSGWQRHEIGFDSFAQRPGLIGRFAPTPTSGPALRTNAIASIHFTTLMTVPFEIWIDDLVLTCNGPCPGETSPGPRVCTPGADQTCNDNPAISSLHGMCTPAGVCVCQPAYAKNPATGKCL